jgi:hypothetical protein
MVNTWKEKDFEENLHSQIDAIYSKIYWNIQGVERALRDSQGILGIKDTQFHIDSTIILADGTPLTVQEKSLKFHQLKHQSLTIEYYNNHKTGERGEFFKGLAQLTFFGYRNAANTSYSQIYLLNNAYLRAKISKHLNINDYIKYNKAPARASFLAIPFSFFKDDKRIVVCQYTSSEAKEILSRI